jgi:hypothetical protein
LGRREHRKGQLAGGREVLRWIWQDEQNCANAIWWGLQDLSSITPTVAAKGESLHRDDAP